MFERYTEKARGAIFFARYDASQYGSRPIETEHLLLGVLRENWELCRYLGSGSTVESIRRRIEAGTTPRQKVSTAEDLPLSEECKRALALGAEEAERLNHSLIATDHLLVGLSREGKCFAAKILTEEGVGIQRVREGAMPAPLSEKISGAELPFGEDCKSAFNFSAEEAAQLRQRPGPAHLLLGIPQVDDCGAAKILRDCGVTAAGIRARLIPPPPPSDPEQGRSYV